MYGYIIALPLDKIICNFSSSLVNLLFVSKKPLITISTRYGKLFSKLYFTPKIILNLFLFSSELAIFIAILGKPTLGSSGS